MFGSAIACGKAVMPSHTKINHVHSLVAGLSIALLGVGFAPAAKANAWNERTVVTISGPMEIPGKILAPGTYVFRLFDSASNRTILKIFDANEQQLDATVVAVTDYREDVTGRPLLQFAERPSNAPPALKAFFYPGELYGLQLVYPYRQAASIARGTHQTVLSMPDDVSVSVQSLKDVPVTPTGD
jgi:hypothetical protein